MPDLMTQPAHRYLFVCGLHRSGTSLITRCLMEHPQVSGFKNTGVIEDEGQFLQSVMPLEIAYGGVGRFGFDPRAHLTEASPLNTPGNARRLLAEWQPHWDLSRPVLIEKTPSNLLRMRLLARLLAPSYFVIVTRHPVATSLATMKWTEGNLFSLLYHWVHCYRIARADAVLLAHTIWVSYEEFVDQPQAVLDRILHFAGLPPGKAPPLKSENGKYFSQWRDVFHGDGERAIEQKPPERPRGLATRLRDRVKHEMHEKALPAYRRKENLRSFHDALDAASLLEEAVQAFGYSFRDLEQRPLQPPPGHR